MIDVIIIGCGSIGALKPNKYDAPDKETVLTWASAFYRMKDKHEIDLYFIDENPRRAELAAIKWCGTVHESIKSYNALKNKNRKSIYIIATPTETHKDIFVEIMQYNHVLIVVEKPFCKDYPEILYINEIYKRSIAVNYSRRYLPSTYVTKQMILTNFLGKIQQCKITYTRGFKRDASHAVDLMNYFFGNCIEGEILNWSNPIIDWGEDDPTYSAYLKYEKCPEVFITGCNGNYFDIFEIDIIGEKSRHVFVDHGKKLKTFQTLPEPTYGNYKTLIDRNYYTTKTQLSSVLHYVVEEILKYVADPDKVKLSCTIEDALNVHKVFHILGV